MICVCSEVVALADPRQNGSQIRKTRKELGSTKKIEIKRKIRSKYHQSETRTESGDSEEEKCMCSSENELEEVKHRCSFGKSSDGFHLTDQCYVCCACQRKLNQHKILTVNDIPSPDHFNRECMIANDTLNVEWKPDVFGLRNANNFALASNLEREDSFDKNIHDDGKVVCTLAVPQIAGWAGFYDQINVSTSDSDKDSGVFSEEQTFIIGSGVQSCKNCMECNTIDDLTKCKLPDKSESDASEKFNEDKSDRENEYENECSLEFEKSRCPFERRVWKRKNGWYKVRDPMCPRPLYKETIDYADHESESGSEHSGPEFEFQENLKFLSDTEAAKEFDSVRERNKITLNQETSDRGQRRQETAGRQDRQGTIKVNEPQGYHGYISDFQVKLTQMKLEIAEMVAEAAELDNTLGQSDDEIGDDMYLHSENWNWDSDTLDYSRSESNSSETEDEDASEDSLQDYESIKYYTL